MAVGNGSVKKLDGEESGVSEGERARSEASRFDICCLSVPHYLIGRCNYSYVEIGIIEK